MTEREHLALIEMALDATLSAMAESVPRQDSTGSEPVGIIRASELEAADLQAIIRDPVRRGCFLLLRYLGQELFDVVGSTNAMRDVMDRVAAMDKQREAKRVTILDRAWDGTGKSPDIWLT